MIKKHLFLRDKRIFKIIANKDSIKYIILILLSMLAWFEFYDKSAYSLNANSLKETVIAFAALKGFSSIVAFANDVSFVGSIMEPFDEFLDRISFLMLISVLSLGIQKIILVILHSFTINFIISFSLFVIILNKFMKIMSFTWAKKIFTFTIILMIIRFSIPLMSLMIYSIEIHTKQIQEEVSQERLTSLSDKLLEIDNYEKSKKRDDLEKQIKIKNIQDKITTDNAQIIKYTKDIADLKYSNKSLVHKISTFISTSSVKKEVAKKIQIIENEIKKLEKQIIEYGQEIKKLKSNFFDFISPTAKIKQAVTHIKFVMRELFDIFIISTALFFVKNVIFPILFLWGLLSLISSHLKYLLQKSLIKN